MFPEIRKSMGLNVFEISSVDPFPDGRVEPTEPSEIYTTLFILDLTSCGNELHAVERACAPPLKLKILIGPGEAAAAMMASITVVVSSV